MATNRELVVAATSLCSTACRCGSIGISKSTLAKDLGFLFCPHVAHATVGIPSLASLGPIGAVPSGHKPLQTPNRSTPHIPAISGVLTSFSPIHCVVHLWACTTGIRARSHTLCSQ